MDALKPDLTAPEGPLNPHTPPTGIVVVIRCKQCGRQTLEFATVRLAQRYAYSHGWRQIGKSYLCDECLKVSRMVARLSRTQVTRK